MSDDEEVIEYPYHFRCNACDASEDFAQYRSNFVCPWCGEGVMEYEEAA